MEERFGERKQPGLKCNVRDESNGSELEYVPIDVSEKVEKKVTIETVKV